MERRDFVRIPLQLPVRYKFVSPGGVKKSDEIYSGETSNLSGGGMLLNGPIPDNDWLVELMLQKILLGVNLLLPGYDDPIKILARVAWVENLTASGDCSMGLHFKEIERVQQDRIVQLIIKNQMS